MKRGRRHRLTRLLRRVATHAALILTCAFALFPVYFMIVTSFSSLPVEAITAMSLLPKASQLTLSSYAAVLYHSSPAFGTLLMNSLIFGGSAALAGVALAAFTGFALSKWNFPGRRSFIYFIIVISLFPSFVMILPFFLEFHELGLVNTYLGLIIPYSAGAVVFSGILVKNYMDSIPDDIEEAALVDGLGRTGAFFRILLPLCLPVLGLAALLAFIGPYTDYALANVFIYSNSLHTLALGLFGDYSRTTSEGTAVWGVVTAFALLMSLPIFAAYMIFQRYIISGLTLGAVRG
jgi:arabinogalactan oligomer / maltooligosaccharide transport system permease protein